MGHPEEEVVCRVVVAPEEALPVVGGAVAVVAAVAPHRDHQSD